MPASETPLAGGNVNLGVVRVGDTVRRRLTPHSAAVHGLLLHLAALGFAGSPRFLGIDDQGREVLSFIPGATGIPPALWRDDAPLVATATLLKAYHAAAATFVPPNAAAWAYSYPDPHRHEVICHNDFAPYNFVYAAQAPDTAPNEAVAAIPIAVIDFDLAGPGPRLRDVAYAAYWLAPLSFSGADMRHHALADLSAGSRRLKLFCRTYGVAADGALLEMVEEVLNHMGSETAARRMVGPAAAERLKAGGHFDHWQREAAAFRTHRPQVEENLFSQERGVK